MGKPCCSVLVLKSFPGKCNNVFHLEEEVPDSYAGRRISCCTSNKKGVRNRPTF